MVNGYLRPDSDWLGQIGPSDKELIKIEMYFEDEDGNEYDINADEMLLEFEMDEEEVRLPEQIGDDFTIGVTSEDDWDATTELEGNVFYVESNVSTSPYVLTTLFGFKIKSITYQGKTYTDFIYV